MVNIVIVGVTINNFKMYYLNTVDTNTQII